MCKYTEENDIAQDVFKEKRQRNLKENETDRKRKISRDEKVKPKRSKDSKELYDVPNKHNTLNTTGKADLEKEEKFHHDLTKSSIKEDSRFQSWF